MLIKQNNYEHSEDLLLRKMALPLLKTISKHFCMTDFVCYFLSLHERFSMEEIERIIILNKNFIDGKVLSLILNNYYVLNDKNQVWLKKLIQQYKCCYSNLDYAQWIAGNKDEYIKWEYCKIFELFNGYSFYDENILEYFAKNKFFIEQLVHQNDVIKFLEKTLAKTFKEEWKYSISQMIMFLLNAAPNINELLNKIFFKLKFHDLREKFPEKILTKQMTLIFQEKQIQTTLDELLKVDCWLDIEDFQTKLAAKKISREDLLRSNLILDDKTNSLLHLLRRSKGWTNVHIFKMQSLHLRIVH